VAKCPSVIYLAAESGGRIENNRVFGNALIDVRVEDGVTAELSGNRGS
jgi:hypothetical protein